MKYALKMPSRLTVRAEPGILPVIAEYADCKTMHILASSLPLKASYDLSNQSRNASQTVLQDRRDYDAALGEAFDELVDIAITEADEVRSIESILESTLFVSARSSFHSGVSEVMSRLHSLQTSPTGFNVYDHGIWVGEGDMYDSPISPAARAEIPLLTEAVNEKVDA